MKTIRNFGLTIAAAAAISSSAAVQGNAQEFGDPPAEPAAASAQDSWYRPPGPRVEKQTLAREKAINRGQQRMARLEAMRWYGFSNSRPTAASMPYTTMYSPAWQQPGGRPFAWYTSSRPVVIYNTAPVYRQ
jgi:hypothetical protein